MLEHLNKSAACWNHYREEVEDLPSERVKAADTEEAARAAEYKLLGVRPLAALEPSCKQYGPRFSQVQQCLAEANEQRKNKPKIDKTKDDAHHERSILITAEKYQDILLHAHVTVTALVVLSLYCGFRRAGDVQHSVEEQIQHEDFTLFVLSVDYAIDRTRCDMSKSTAIGFWADRIKAGQVISLAAGPPCETWSVARHHEGGPPPLRHAEALHGLAGLTLKQHRQVRVGNALYYAAL
jgi:hypothetical protein